MTEQELCAAYGVDPDGQYAYEAADRITRLRHHLSIDYLDTLGVNSRATTEEFDFSEERLYAQDTETWAFEHGFEQIVELASNANSHFSTLLQFSSRLIRLTREEHAQDNPVVPWPEQLQAGDYDPDIVIRAINSWLQEGEHIQEQALGYGDGVFNFVVDLVALANDRHQGDIGRVLGDKFKLGSPVRWVQYRGVRARIAPAPVDRQSLFQSVAWLVTVVGAPDGFPCLPVACEPNEPAALEWLHKVVDECMAQRPALTGTPH